MRVFSQYWYWLVAAVISLAGIFYLINKDASASPEQKMPEIVDFNFHIRPVLSDRCFKCHGPDANQRKANLRLDTEEGLYQALQDDPHAQVIVKGEAEASELFRRLISEDTTQVMPPRSSNLVVTDFERKLIEKWIDQGAEWKQYWAFIPPVMPASLSKKDDEVSAIDFLVNQKN